MFCFFRGGGVGRGVGCGDLTCFSLYHVLSVILPPLRFQDVILFFVMMQCIYFQIFYVAS